MPTNDYYDHGTFPTTGSPGSSASMGSEFDLITTGMDKLAPLAGNGGKLIKVNAAGTAQESSKVGFTEPATSCTVAIADGSTFATVGAYVVTLTATGATGITLPTTGTLTTLAGAELLSNKTLVAPALGTPASGVLTNCTGTASGLTAGNAAVAATVTTNANLTGHIASTGNAAVLGSFSVAQLNAALNDGDIVPAGLATASGLTQSTAKILGRSTAATGAVEEIAVAGGLTLSVGSLSAGFASGTTSIVIATGGVQPADITVAHGLGTDAIDFGFEWSHSVATKEIQTDIAARGYSNGFYLAGWGYNRSSIALPAAPAVGNISMAAMSLTAGTITINWWARKR